MTEHLLLPERLDSSAAPALAETLLQRRGAALVLDAGQVAIIGALAFEVIIAAGRQWAADGKDLTVVAPSARYTAASLALGLQPSAPWQLALGDAA